MSTTQWKEEAYRKAYDGALALLRARREADPAFSENDVRAVLKTLYETQGRDWEGRGEAASLDLEATIDAHEYYLAGWNGSVHTPSGALAADGE
jgi:hypothetical protein